jgi:hypothetical protein
VEAQVAYPSGEEASLDEPDGGPVLGKESGQLVAAGGQGGEAVVVDGAITASDALVFAEVESENDAVGGVGGGRDGGVNGKLLWGEG